MDRPTFHESWHRVADLRPRLRGSIRVIRQNFRGERWHVLEDPASGLFFRINGTAYDFVARLDGRSTVDLAWRQCIEHRGDDAMTQGEAIGLLGQMWRSNLIWAEAPADTRSMFARQRERKARELRGYVSSLFFLRLPLFDPDPLLNRWAPLLGWLFGPIGAVLWALMVVVGFWHVVDRPGALASGAASILSGDNLLPLYLTYAMIKALHEMGHAVSCKVFGQRSGTGGEVHAIGVMFLLFLPIPYVDASSSWALRSRAQRMVIAAAGILIEVACAAVAAVVWARTAEGSLTHAIAYNAMFLSSLSTILFNGNPLLRYDGYYVLSDLIGVPNLAQRSQEYLKWMVRSAAWRVRGVRNPATSPSEAAWLASYGVLSMAYRMVVYAGLAVFIASQQFLLGGAILIVGVVLWCFVPAGRFVHYLLRSPELERSRRRAVLSTLAALGAVLLPGLLVPVPDHARAEGVSEPREYEVVHAKADGFVERAAPSGSQAGPGSDEPLVVQRNDELERRREALLAELERLRVTRALAFRDDPARAFQIDRQVSAAEDQARSVAEQVASLRVRSSVSGQWIAPRADHLVGAYLARGATIGLVADLSGMRLRVVLDQRTASAIIDEAATSVDVRALGRPSQRIHATLLRVLPAGQRQLPSASLGIIGGGATPTIAADERNLTATEEVFEAWIDLPADHGLLPGQRVIARFTLTPRPILIQAGRALRQVLQERFNI